MEKPLLILDLDEVLFDTIGTVNHVYNQIHKTKFSRDDFHCYHWHDIWGISLDEALTFIDWFFIQYPTAIRPIQKAQDAVEELSRKYHIQSVTARPEHIREGTEIAVKTYFPQIGDIHMVSSYRGEQRLKSEVIASLNAHAFVEDQFHHVEDVAPHVHLAVLINTPWNKEEYILPDNVVRSDSLHAALPYLLNSKH